MTVEPKGVAVFAPAPLLSVMVEAGAEHPEIHLHAGGQGPWVANMLAVLQTRTLLCTALGGETGRVVRAVLDQEWIDVRCVPVAASTSCGVEDRRSGDLESVAVTPTARLDRHERDELCNLVLAAGLDMGVVVLTGSILDEAVPVDTYRRVAADLTRLGVTVVADLSGEALDAALEGGVTVLKVSDDELGSDDAVEAVRMLRKRAETVVLTRGADPALLFGVGDEVCSVQVPALQSVDPRGAGDSMTAGIAAGLARGWGVVESVRLGAAAGAVNATRHGLATGRRDTVERLADCVVIAPATEEEVRRARTGHQ